MTLSDRLSAIFEAIVDQYDAQPEERRMRLLHLRSLAGEGFNGWGEDLPSVTKDDLDDLDSFGLIDIDFGDRGHYLVKPSPFGRNQLREMRRELALNERADPVDLSWAAVRPVLHAVVDAWTEAGAPSSGYVRAEALAKRLERDPQDLGLYRAVQYLAAGDWLEMTFDDADDVLARPTMRAVLATRSWPGGDGEVAAERLITALDAAAQTGDERSRGLMARLRDTAMEVGTKTLAEVVSKSVGTAV